jgi:hypothetical protein
MSSIYKRIKIVKILSLIGLLSIIFLQSVNNSYAEESIESLCLSGNEVRIIENEMLTINKTITITENATLYVINSKITISLGANITLKDPKDGNPRLIIMNSTLEAKPAVKYQVYTYGNSVITIDQSVITRAEFITADSSNVTITNPANNPTNLIASFLLKGSSVVSIYSSKLVKEEIIKGMPKIEAIENSSILFEKVSFDTPVYLIGRDSAKISLLTSPGPSSEIQMYKNSQVFVSGGNKFLNFKFYDSSKGKLENIGLIYNVYAYNFTEVELINTAIFERVRAYDHAYLYLEKTNVGYNPGVEKDPTEKKLGSGLSAIAGAKLTIVNCKIDITRIFDDAKATFISTDIKDSRFYNYSSISISGSVEKIFCNFNDYSHGLLNLKSKGEININAKNYAKLVIKDSDVVRRLSLNEYAKAYVLNSAFQLVNVKDYTEASMITSKIYGYLAMSNNAFIKINGSIAALTEMADLSKIIISSNSIMNSIIVKDFSQITAENSEIGELTIQLSSVQAHFLDVKLKTFEKWDMYTNASLYVFEEGKSPSISLNNVSITRGWNFFIDGDSKVKFTNCRLNTLEAFKYCMIQLYNTTAQYQILKDFTQIEVYWYLDITAFNGTTISVKDMNNQEISFMNVTNNQVRFILFEKFINETETITANKYTIDIDYNGQHSQQKIVVTSNMAFDFTQSSWWETNWYVVLIPIVIGVLLAVLIYYRIKRGRKVKTKI